MNESLIEQWCSFQTDVRGLSRATVKRRRWSLGTLSERVVLVDCTEQQIEDWLASFAGVQTRQSVHADARQFYKWAVRKGHVAADPTTHVEMVKVPSRLPTPIAEVDIERLIRHAVGDLRAMILLACHAGLRVSEIAALRGEDVQHGCVIVRAGKGAKDRSVPLSDEALAALPHRSGLLFPQCGARGKSVSGRIRYAMRALCIAGRPHDLRHSFGTQLARRRTDLIVIAQLMGHADVSTTQGYILLAAPDRALVQNLYGAAA